MKYTVGRWVTRGPLPGDTDSDPRVYVSVEVDMDAETDDLRRLDAIAEEVARRCPGCWAEVGVWHADDCPLR